MRLLKETILPSLWFFIFFFVLTGIIYTLFMTGIAELFFPFQARGSLLTANDGKQYSMLLGQSYTKDEYLWGRIQDYDWAVSSKSDFYAGTSTADNFLGDGSNSNYIPHSHGKDEVLMYSWASNRSPAGDNSTDVKHSPEGINKGRIDPDKNPQDYIDYAEDSGWTEGLIRQHVAERVARLHEANTRYGIPNDTPIPVALVTNSGSGLDPHIPPAAAEYQVQRIARSRGISEDTVRDIIKKCTTGRTFGVFGEPHVHVLKVNLMLDGKL